MISRSLYRKIAFWEGISFLAILFVSMPLKYMADILWPNQIIGMAHGLLFVLYLIAWWENRKGTSGRVLFIQAAASILPFGTFMVEKRGLYQLEDSPN